MKTQSILVTIMVAGAATAQTGLIAHKSHSGTAATYALADPDNFGGPAIMPKLEKKLDKVTWLNDTTVVFSGKMAYGYFLETYQSPDDTLTSEGADYRDTIYNHPLFSDASMPLDTLKKAYMDVEFENFDKKEIKTPTKQSARKKARSKTAPATDEHRKVGKPKQKKSSLFWLWIIGGGTFMGILLASGKKKPVMEKP